MARVAGRALGVFFVASLVLGALGACRDEPALGGFGEACNIDEQCRGDMSCNIDILDGVCTTACGSDAECTQEFANSRCYTGVSSADAGGSLSWCVMSCEADEGCPHGTVCNNLGWCGRSSTVVDNTGTGGGGPGTGGAGGTATGGAGGTGGADAAAGTGTADAAVDAGP